MYNSLWYTVKRLVVSYNRDTLTITVKKKNWKLLKKSKMYTYAAYSSIYLQRYRSTVDDINNAVKENRRNVVNRRISQPKKLLQHFLENTMEQMGIQLDASRKKELSQQKSSKR